MRTRRLFWLGAAILLTAAALVAIAAVLTGDFGPTQGRILGTVGLLFACGSTVLAGRACLERRVVLPFAYATMGLAPVAFVYWSVGVWTTYESRTAGKLLGVLAAWMVALLLATTLRLVLRSERLWRLYAATVACAVGAAAFATLLVARDSATGWQGLAIFVILAAVGTFLIPILQRFTAAGAPERPAERLLGMLDGVEVVAVHGDARTVRIGPASARIAGDESVLVRERG